MAKETALKGIKLFVLDMDGTYYLGKNRLKGANEFLERVHDVGKDFVFFTNNSSKSPSKYIDKLATMDCIIDRNKIWTSGDVTIEFLKTNRSGKKIYLVGTPSLQESFEQAGIILVKEEPDIVVIGFDTTLTYEKLEKACTYIRNGAEFLATHLDINCPIENGFIPDCGSICNLITTSTGVKPKFLGKPYPETMDLVLRKTGFAKEEIAFVGDRIYTDVATGVKNGAMGILVLTGETKLEDVEASSIKPDAIYESLEEMIRYL